MAEAIVLTIFGLVTGIISVIEGIRAPEAAVPMFTLTAFSVVMVVAGLSLIIYNVKKRK